MERLAYEDIQGIILRGYKELPFARFVLLRIERVDDARAWLGRLPVNPASKRHPKDATHVAFTARGLATLGLSEDELGEFAPEFKEGMSGSEHRRRLLGDTGDNAPLHWDWGGPGQPEVDAIALFYAANAAELDALHGGACGTTLEEHASRGIRVVRTLETHTLQDGKRYWFREHFGFRDGVAQPSLGIANPGDEERGGGIAKPSDAGNTVEPGEFLFGYPTEYGTRPLGGGPEGIAKNGSFLVFRQLEQKVVEFWDFMRKKAKEIRVDPIWLAAKMVGRWPSGAPLALAPNEDTAGLETFDAFGYRDADPKGSACPFSSHIRRANPRDTLLDDSEESLRLVKTHRLVRRGRPYGRPVFEPLEPALFVPKLDSLSVPPGGRGLHFLCFNTSIRRQFEFVQQTWLNNPKFASQYAAPDPIAGQFEGSDSEFSLAGCPAQTRITEIRSFVESKGGAYFFMPGLAALRAIVARGAAPQGNRMT